MDCVNVCARINRTMTINPIQKLRPYQPCKMWVVFERFYVMNLVINFARPFNTQRRHSLRLSIYHWWYQKSFIIHATSILFANTNTNTHIPKHSNRWLNGSTSFVEYQCINKINGFRKDGQNSESESNTKKVERRTIQATEALILIGAVLVMPLVGNKESLWHISRPHTSNR